MHGGGCGINNEWLDRRTQPIGWPALRHPDEKNAGKKPLTIHSVRSVKRSNVIRREAASFNKSVEATAPGRLLEVDFFMFISFLRGEAPAYGAVPHLGR